MSVGAHSYPSDTGDCCRKRNAHLAVHGSGQVYAPGLPKTITITLRGSGADRRDYPGQNKCAALQQLFTGLQRNEWIDLLGHKEFVVFLTGTVNGFLVFVSMGVP